MNTSESIKDKSFEQRVDKLAMLYMQGHYDIKSMSVEEFLKTFDKTCLEIMSATQTIK